jgi:hypothetical protein
MKLPCPSSLVLPVLAITLVAASPSGSVQAAAAKPSCSQADSSPQVKPAPSAYSGSNGSFDIPIGIFDGQSDVGSPHVRSNARYDEGTKQYTIDSGGYNVVYTRDEFRYLWKKMSGDVSLAADISFPNPNGYDGRKAVLVIRQSLDDDSREAVAALYGNGVFRLGQRPKKGARRSDMDYRVWSREAPAIPPARNISVVLMPKRIAIAKYGDTVLILVSMQGEPMHAFGPPLILHMDEPFYVGIGFCSNLPDKSDVAIFSNVVLEKPSPAASHRAAAAPTP